MAPPLALALFLFCVHLAASVPSSIFATLDAHISQFSNLCSASQNPICSSYIPSNSHSIPPFPGAPIAHSKPINDTATIAALFNVSIDLAATLSLVKEYRNAAKLRSSVLEESERVGDTVALPTTRVALLTALGHDFRHSRSYGDALIAVREAQKLTLESSPILPVLQAFEAEVLSCSGDAHAVTALQVFARSKKGRSGVDAGFGISLQLQELDLLRRVLGIPEGAPNCPPAFLRTGLEKRHQSLVANMLGSGPWRNALQISRHYTPGLLSLPWHDIHHWPHSVAKVSLLLEGATIGLVEEYKALRNGGHLIPETECIAEPLWLKGKKGGGGTPSGIQEEKGGWWVYTCNGPWLRDVDANNGCSLLTPIACALMVQASALGLKPTRVGYSALTPGAFLHPHHGATNTVLKLHLGLLVPQNSRGGACANLTVGGETRAWKAGGVLAFDDSFLHSVRFDDKEECGRKGERVVLQLVFEHPDLVTRTTVKSIE